MNGDTRKAVATLRTAIHLEVVTGLAGAGSSAGTRHGVLTRSMLLNTLGLDSIIELGSGVVLLWRLRAETQRKPGDAPDLLWVEHQATCVSAWLLEGLYL